MLDILIRNGDLIDGSGAPRRRADLAIQGDRIVDIGSLPAAMAHTVIDAAGHIVAPGFVDMHSHADFTLPLRPTADSLLHQGITTIVMGQCGGSPAPLLDDTRAQVIAGQGDDDDRLPFEEWSSFGSFLDYLARIGVSPNVVPLVGQGTIRTGVMLYTAAAPNTAQMARMQAEVTKAMEEGAIGVSTGLIYPPGSYASTEELIDVVRPAGKLHGFYFSHIRGEDDTLLDAVAEAIRIGRETGAAVQVSHFKFMRSRNWDKTAKALALIDRARAEGLDVSADLYPYVASSTSLAALLPEWAHEGGRDALLKRLADPQTRQRIGAELLDSDWPWDRILVSGSPRKREFEGHYVSELAAASGKSPHAWLFEALLETEAQISQVNFAMSEENRAIELRHPAMMIGTDGAGLAPTGVLSDGLPHPRSYGTFPRVLGYYVRQRHVLTLEEAIHKMSGLPAHKLRWTDRGLLRPGDKADVVVFDPATIQDTATFQQPHQYPVGIQAVLVNGKIVVQGNQHTGALPGEILRRH